MDIKKRRRRRIGILVLVTLLILGGLVGVIVLQRAKREREAQWHRAEGLAALEAKDYPAAIEHLRPYLERDRNDAEALHAFARANLQVPQPRNGHLRLALEALKLAVELDPKNREATHELIEIYRLIGANDQTLELANRLLQDDPSDARAMGDKAIALSRLDRIDEARDVALDAVRLDPENYRLHLILLQVQRQMKTSREDLAGYGEEQARKHPGDPRFELVAGLASAIAPEQDNEAAKRWLRQAASRDLEDPRLAADLVAVLDTLGMWGDSLAVLEKATRHGDPNLATDYYRRLFESERHADVVQRLEGTDPASRETKLEHQLLRAMAMQNLGQHAEAHAVLTKIAQRTDTPLAKVWADVLMMVYDPKLELPRRVEALKEAMTTIIDNAYLHTYLGDAYSALGENDMALQHWQRAADLRQPWANVRLLVAHALINARRPAEAVNYAEAALLRMPDSLPAAITAVRARAEAMGTIDGDSPQRLLELIDKVQAAAAGEPQSLLARVDMLARLGRRDEAQETALTLIERERDLPKPLLANLAEVSRRHGLDLEQRVEARFVQQMEGTPDLTLAQASDLARQGQVKEGLALLDKGLAEAQPREKLGWELARATYLDAVGDPAAAQTWTRLADSNAGDRRVQQMALRARSVQGDRAFTEQVLTRLQSLMGNDNVTWQTERARWLVGSGRESDATQAVTLLRQVIERAPKRLDARLLLAQTLVQLNRPQLAIQELRAAEQAVPNSAELSLELARLYQAQREFPNALSSIERALAASGLTDAHRRDAAMLLARQGEAAQAVTLMERLTADDGGSPEERLLLASLYARADRAADVERLLPPLLEQPTPQALALALEFYQQQGRTDRVNELVSLVESAAIPEAGKHRILADHAARTGDVEAAAERLAAATQAAPQDVELWRGRVRLHLMQGQGQEAVAAAQAGLKHTPNAASLKAVVDHAQLVTSQASDPWTRRVLLSMVEEPASAEAGAAALRVAATTPADRAAAESRAAQLADLARQNPSVLSLQLLAARALMETAQTDAAVDVTTRAATAFPQNLEPLAMQAEALAAANRWADALAAAAEWRKRTPDAAQSPDLIMAEALLHLDQPDRALQQLEPYAQQALSDPDAHRDVVSRRLRAQVALKRYDEAWRVLSPLLPTSSAWRGLAMGLASSNVQDPRVAAEWMRQTAAQIPAGDTEERMVAVQAWWNLAQQHKDPALAQEAGRVVTELTDQPEAPAAAWYMRGVVAEQSGDTSAAEQAYREALRRDGNVVAAKNNLAMIVASREGGAAEALQLAESATQAEPENASYLDTLAFVQAKAGQTDRAIETMQKVIAMDPTTKLWYDNLAQILRDAGKPDEAKQVLDQYQARALRL